MTSHRNENRRAPRSRHDSVLELYDSSGHLIAGVGRLVDFSQVGACFSTPQILEKGQDLRVRVRLLKEGILEATARVVWLRKKVNTILYGIEFHTVHKRIKK